MEASAIFSLANTVAAIAWLFLIVGARWLPRTFQIVRWAVPAVFALIYIATLSRGDTPDDASFQTLEGVAALFTNPWSLLAGWLHYLAFDFFVGCWILEKSKSEGISHWIIIVPLIATFMLGPVGWLLFAVVLGVHSWKNENRKHPDRQP